MYYLVEAKRTSKQRPLFVLFGCEFSEDKKTLVAQGWAFNKPVRENSLITVAVDGKSIAKIRVPKVDEPFALKSKLEIICEEFYE